MIEAISISALGVIEESVLELGPGLNVITGETGAGKTMVVTAVGLLLGGRADPGAVRTGAPRARVEGVLDLSPAAVAPAVRQAVEEIVADAGGDVGDGVRADGPAPNGSQGGPGGHKGGGGPAGSRAGDPHLLLARHVSAEGRSRAYAGGTGVPASVLTRLGAHLIAIHGQSDQHRLLRAEDQRDALDRYAGDRAATLATAFARDHRALRAARSELAQIKAQTRQRAQEADLLRFGLGEIEALAPKPGEDSELSAEETRLGFADHLRTAALQARQALSADETTTIEPAGDVLGLLSVARRSLDSVREHDAEAGALADRLAEIGYLASDAAADVASYSTSVETDPTRLAQVSERRAALTRLTRKYGDTVEEVLEWARAGSLRLLRLEDTEEEIEALGAAITDLEARLITCGGALSRARTEAAVLLSRRITEEITQLAMPHARLHIAVTDTLAATGADTSVVLDVGGRRLVCTESGWDRVEFLLTANPGAAPRPLGRGASGGELSRVMLGLEVALADTDPVPTFVFDEVDAGVGGAAAVEVGRRLAMLAHHAQVVVVTHLPQVAAFADRHVVISKSYDGAITTSGLEVLDDSGRVQELSRMMAGQEDSATARAHAEELLGTARLARRRGTEHVTMKGS